MKYWKKAFSKYGAEVLLGIMLLLAAGVNVHYADTKEGLFCDEVFSYGLSNSVWYTFLDMNSAEGYSDGGTGWVDSAFFEDYLVVRDWERMSYGQVWKNQEQDTLPPLYYALLHFVCALTPDRYSKWQGLSINFICMALSVFLLYRLTGKYLEKKYALFPCVVWCLSAAGISTFTYIRMYALLACIVLALCNLFTDVVLSGHVLTGKRWIGLNILLVAGTLTHYYFIVFAVLLAAVYLPYLCRTKRWKTILGLGCSCVVSAAAVLLIFPAAVGHIGSGYRGAESVQNLLEGARDGGWRGHYYNMDHTFFGGLLPVVIIAAVCSVVVLILKRKRNRERNARVLWGWVMISAAVCYILIIMRIAPYSYVKGNRYLYMVYPLLAFLLACLFDHIPGKVRLLSMLLFSGWIAASSVLGGNILWQNEDEAARQTLAAEDSDMDCIYVCDGGQWFDTYGLIFEWMKYDEVRFVHRGDIGVLDTILSWRRTESDGLVVAFWPYFTQDEIQQFTGEIMEITGYNGIEYCYRNETSALVCRLYNDKEERLYEDGSMVTSREVYTDSGWHWYDENGIMAVRKDVWLESDGGKWVHFDENGNMLKGEQFRNDGWYYYDTETGALTTGAVVLRDGRKVYYDTDTGKMLRGKQTINGKFYYFDHIDGHLILGSDRMWR